MILPGDIVEAPKRPVQTPQREWLRGPLYAWANDRIECALDAFGDSWLKPDMVRSAWDAFAAGSGSNSFFVWQWVSLGMIGRRPGYVATAGARNFTCRASSH
jgi:asparagine synthase (glutamine-hydrolysing)